MEQFQNTWRTLVCPFPSPLEVIWKVQCVTTNKSFPHRFCEESEVSEFSINQMPENCLKRGRDTGFTEMQLVPMDDWGTQVTVKSSRISLDRSTEKEEACKTPHLPPNQEYISRKNLTSASKKKKKKGKTSQTNKTPQNPSTLPSIT